MYIPQSRESPTSGERTPVEDPIEDIDPGETLESVSEMIIKMKSGATLVRYCDIGSASTTSKPAAHTCSARLSDSLEEILFVVQGEKRAPEVSDSVLQLSRVEQVEASSLDKFSVVLLLPLDMEIIELIFASEEDWRTWLYGLRVLCTKKVSTKDLNMTQIQAEESPSPAQLTELYGLVDQLESQNVILRSIKLGYEATFEEAKNSLKTKDEEICNLRNLLELRDETIRELTASVHSLLVKQNILSSKLADSYSSVGRDPPRPNKSDNIALASSKTSTASGSLDLGVQGLDRLEDQLKKLDERKRQLERLLASVEGA